LFPRNCGLAEKTVGTPVPLLDNPLAPPPALTFVELRDTAIPMLLALGPSMHYDPVLMYKVLRLAKSALSRVRTEKLTNKVLAFILNNNLCFYY
jgi:hypothetical protein